MCSLLNQWATLRMETGAKEKNQQLYKPYSNGNQVIFQYFSAMNAYCTCSVLTINSNAHISSFPSHCRNHSQRTTVVLAAGDPGAPRFCQLSAALRARVWDGWHLLLLPERRGEHRGRRGDQALLSPGAGELELADPKQLQLPSHQSETYCPVGTGSPHPLRRPVAPQVRAAQGQVMR